MTNTNEQTPPIPLKKQAFMIEQFVSGTSVRELADMNSLTFDQAHLIIKQWYPQGNHTLSLPSMAVNSTRQQFIKAYSDKLSEKDMADALGITTSTVRRSLIGLYIVRKKSVYANPIPFHYLKVSIILNQETGIYYFSASEAADTVGKNEHWLRNRITKMIAVNNTAFIYCGKYK